jgi:hypothetical protein
MSDAAQEQIKLLSQQRDRLMKSLEESQPYARSEQNASDAIVDVDVLSFAVHNALSDAMASKSIEDHSRYQRTIEDLQNRLAATEVRARAPHALLHRQQSNVLSRGS